jgi:hypothetical protein
VCLKEEPIHTPQSLEQKTEPKWAHASAGRRWQTPARAGCFCLVAPAAVCTAQSATQAPQEGLFLDSSLLEEAGAHNMAGGAQIWPPVLKAGK